MSSMKASVEGLLLIKQAIVQKGWRLRDDRWLVAASYTLEPDGNWQPDGPYAYGCSLQTWERFLRGVAIRDRSFLAFCKVLRLSPIHIANTIFSNKLNPLDETTFAACGKELEEIERYNASLYSLLSRIVLLEHRISEIENRLNAASSKLQDDSSR